ncbi:hypothetical protein [Hyalangium rubrum]|uniref:Uncharacterized protein n=1 Tax=Hyalangium rubrum TaxID=3103134 RepID=A0ABU5HH62_9BACT|nr:hypothetical protein [Hyalangium sp. s54d21]MDY7232808.1 hypothetical protein [Hyalangium sp. s54d21]
MLSLLFCSPLAFFVLCVLTFPATILFFLPFPQGDLGSQSLQLLTSGRLRLWHMLIAVQPMLWVASLLIVSHDLKRSRSAWPGTWRERTVVVLCTLLLATLTTFPVLATNRAPSSPLTPDLDALLQLPDFRTRALILGLLYAGAVTLHTFGMFTVHVQLIGRLRRSPSHEDAPEAVELEEEVSWYLRLRSQLERFFSLTATIIGTASLSVGAFRNLLNELRASPSEAMPASLVLVHGIYFSLLLALVYLPAHKTLSDVGQRLTDRLVRQSIGAGTTWQSWSQEQQAVRAYLGLQSTALLEFQKGITVLAPLVASLSSLLLGSQG